MACGLSFFPINHQLIPIHFLKAMHPIRLDLDSSSPPWLPT